MTSSSLEFFNPELGIMLPQQADQKGKGKYHLN